MQYLIAILLPPLGLLIVGRWFQAFVCLLLLLTLIGWPLAALWAMLVVHEHRVDRRMYRMMTAHR